MSSKHKTLHLTFRDRRDAGTALGKELLKRRDWQDPVVLALPRGGVPVAAEVARELDAPLELLYRDGQPPLQLEGREAILVDEGLITGATMRAAVQAARKLSPDRITLAVPVGAHESCDALAGIADDVVCVRTPEPFGGIEDWYTDFPPVSDEEVNTLVTLAQRHIES
jgi:putative phosphoribosyl transferase